MKKLKIGTEFIQYQLTGKALDAYRQFKDEDAKWEYRWRAVSTRIREKLQLPEECACVFIRGNWFGYDESAYGLARTAFCMPKRGWCRPRESTKIGKWVSGQIKSVKRPDVFDRMREFGISGMYMCSGGPTGTLVRVPQFVEYGREVFVYGIPKKGSDRVNGGLSDVSAELVEISFTRWATIVQAIHHEVEG